MFPVKYYTSFGMFIKYFGTLIFISCNVLNIIGLFNQFYKVE